MALDYHSIPDFPADPVWSFWLHFPDVYHFLCNAWVQICTSVIVKQHNFPSFSCCGCGAPCTRAPVSWQQYASSIPNFVAEEQVDKEYHSTTRHEKCKSDEGESSWRRRGVQSPILRGTPDSLSCGAVACLGKMKGTRARMFLQRCSEIGD